MRRWRTVILVALAAMGIAGGFVAWKLWPRERAYVTDARNIRTPVEEAQLRDILWDAPERADDVLRLTNGSTDYAIDADIRRLVYVRGSGAASDIFSRERIGDEWSDAVAIQSVNTTHAEIDVALSDDGTTLLFASDRPGSVGGFDLFVSRFQAGAWLPPEPIVAANSMADDVSPAILRDGRIFFSSNRPHAHIESPNDTNVDVVDDDAETLFDLYQVKLHGISESIPIATANSTANDIAPAVSTASDFLYFASDRQGGAGGYDLYRVRILAKAFGAPERLDAAINTAGDERDARLGLGGFSLVYRSSTKGGETALLRANSREVFRDIAIERGAIDWAELWRQIAPNLLWAALALLLTLLFLAMVRDFRDRKVSLLARCLVVSLLSHLVLMLLFNVLKVSTTIASALGGKERIRVALTPTAAAGEFGEQIRGGFVEIDTFEFELPTESPPALEAASVAMPTPIESTPSSSTNAIDRLVTASDLSIEAIDSHESDSMPAISHAPVPAPPTSDLADASTHEITFPTVDTPVAATESTLPSATEFVSATDSDVESVAPRIPTSQPALADSFEMGVESTDRGMPDSAKVAVAINMTDAPAESDLPETAYAGAPSAMTSSEYAPIKLEVAIPFTGERVAVAEATSEVATEGTPSEAASETRADLAFSMAGDATLKEVGVQSMNGLNPANDGAVDVAIDAIDAATASSIPIHSDFSDVGLPTVNFASFDVAMPNAPNDRTAAVPSLNAEPTVLVALISVRSASSRAALPNEALMDNQAGQFALALFDPATDGEWLVADAAPIRNPPNPNESATDGDVGIYYESLTPAINLEQVAIGVPTAPKPKEAAPPRFARGAIGRIVGTVVDADTGRGLDAARVLLNLPDDDTISVRTDPYGAYEIDVPDVPEHFALSASRAGFLPESLNIPRSRVAQRVLTVNFALSRESELVIALEDEPVVHHLGNDRFEGRINSQFQRESEGNTFRANFTVTRDQLPPNYSRAKIQLLVKGVQCAHQVRINGRLVKQRLARSPVDGSFGEYEAEFDPGWLLDGDNQFKIRARSCSGDLDDFEFVNVQFRLMP